MCKTTTLFNQVVLEHHPELKDAGNISIKDLIKIFSPRVLNIEYLIEETIASLTGSSFVDGHHYDLSDGTEIKTASVTPRPTKPGGNSYRLEISNVVSAGGTMKSGDIRLVLYNAVNDSVKFYHIPNTELEGLGINTHPTTKHGRIFCTWNAKSDRCAKLDKFEVDSFQALCSL